MTKQEMIMAIAKHYHIEKNVDWARFFKIEPQTAFQRRKQGIMTYEEIYQKCPDISPDWLLSGGEGPMLRSERENYSGAQPNFSSSSESLEKALDALAKEQESVKRAQEQISGLIAILQKGQ